MALGDVLRRFRFHGVPGAPIAVGVPGDRIAELEAELSPVFGALEEAQRQTAALISTAQREADRNRINASKEATELVTEARHETARERRETAATQVALVDVECDRVLAEGHAETTRVEEQSAERMGPLVDLVVNRVLSLRVTNPGTRR